jgi:Ser/Thr protein kinase RdoA (MazF antagonist)
MWRLTTTVGDFAVKAMRAHAENPDYRDNIEAAFAIEMNAYRAGVPCPEPLPTSDGNALLRDGGTWVRVHRWCNGAMPTRGTCLEDVGLLLAGIHRAGERSVGTLDDHPPGVDTWESLAEQPGLPEAFAGRLRSAAPELARLAAQTSAGPDLETPYADTHGDLDPKNALLSDDRLMAVDWDAAAPRSIFREVVSVALDWADGAEDFRRVLMAYAGSADSGPPAEPWVFGGWVASLIDWLVYNVEQRADTELGQREASATCARLLAFTRVLDEYVSVLDEV